MDFNTVIENRHSIKTFDDKKVPEDKIQRIIECASMAPSWKNERCWKFILVDNQTIKKQVSDTVPNSNSAKNSLEEAPVIVVLCAEPDASGTIDEKEYYMVDSGIAMEHLVLAAVNEGLGTCWIGVFDEDKLREILDIPRKYRIVAMTPLGYSRESWNASNVVDINSIAFMNEWDNPISYKQ